MPNDHVTTVPVLGIPVTFHSNAPEALARFEASFGQWRRLRPWSDLIAPTGVTVSVEVIDAGGASIQDGPVEYRLADEHRVEFSTGTSKGVADAAVGRAEITVTESLLSDGARFGYGVLEGLTLFLVSKQDRQPLHAAFVRRGDDAVLLAGPAGTGKSSVAFAAVRLGLGELLSDDAVYVALGGEPLLWGVPGRTYLPEDTTRRFVDLAGARSVRLPSGKDKAPVETPFAWNRPPTASRVRVCLLARDGRPLRLGPASTDEIVRELTQDLAPQRMLYPRTLEAAAEWVAAAGGWRLTLSDDPVEAARCLEQVFAEFGRA